MASNIGTSISYQAQDFLDERQGMAKTKEDLLNWSIPVPEGFRVCMKGEWYYYNPLVTLPDTGHWVPTISRGLSDVVDENNQVISATMAQELQDTIDKVSGSIDSINNTWSPTTITDMIVSSRYSSANDATNSVNTVLTSVTSLISSKKYEEMYDINKDGIIDSKDVEKWMAHFILAGNGAFFTGLTSSYTLDLGKYTIPKVTWKVQKPILGVSVNGNSVSWYVKEYENVERASVSITENEFGTGYLGDNVWSGFEAIGSKEPKTYTFTLSTDKMSKDAQINFRYRTYYCSGSLDIWSLPSISDFTGWGSEFTSGGTMGEKFFNCSGGKYPYILIPSLYYSSSHKTYVNKNLNSDFLTRNVTVSLNDLSLDYTMLRTNYIQTGSNIGISVA